MSGRMNDKLLARDKVQSDGSRIMASALSSENFASGSHDEIDAPSTCAATHNYYEFELTPRSIAAIFFSYKGLVYVRSNSERHQ